MTLEACQTFGWPYAGIAKRLQDHPDEIQKLSRFRQMLDTILRIGVTAVAVTAQEVLLAADISRTHGLLSGDALIVETMRSRGLVNLASADEDFDRVPDIMRFGLL